MNEPAQPSAKIGAVRLFHGGRRARTQRGKRANGAPTGCHRVSESEARRDQAYDLLIAAVGVTVDEPDRVFTASRLGITAREQRV